jgi:signal transduction histidine kinase
LTIPFFHQAKPFTGVPEPYQQGYADELQRLNLQSARVLTLVGFALVPASAVLDYFIYPNVLRYLLTTRAIMSGGCFILFALTFVKRIQPYSSWITVGLMAIVGGGIAHMLRVLGYQDPYYAGLNLIYLSLILTPWGLWRTLMTCGMVYGFYLIPILLFDLHALKVAAFVNNNVFQLETIIIAVVVNHFQFIRRKTEIINRLTIVRQAEELEQIDKYKREFISNITHELKTPLAIAMGNADLIMEKTDDKEIRDGIEVIRAAAFQLASHVDRIIAVSNVDDPDAKPDLGNYDYVGIMQNVFSAFVPTAKSENIAYTLNTVQGPIVVNADVIKIEEVLNNLIQNAFKFTPSGGSVTVTVSSDGENVFTEVADSGVGIPEDKIGRIFDRMVQADDVLSKRHGGMGIGLYVVKKNVEVHGGKVTANSKEGKGTCFKFHLPLYLDQTARVKNPSYIPAAPNATSLRPSGERRSGVDRRAEERRRSFEYCRNMGIDALARMTFADNVFDFENQNPCRPTILILEDNLGMMKVVVETLREDYNLLLAEDALVGLEKLEAAADKVSLILSDIMMPKMSGFDFLQKIAAEERYQHIPLIFITALMSQEDQLKGFALGATDYIVKPYNIKILKEKVDHWIARRKYEILLKEASSILESRLTQLARTKDIILHEIGNPLQMISGAGYFIEKLRNDRLPEAPERERKLWESTRALDHGIKALRSVLETTKHIDLAEGPFRRPETIKNIIEAAIDQTRHLTAGISVELDLDGSDETVDCDKRMLVQVLVNLIRNAVEAMIEKHPASIGRALKISTEIDKGRNIQIRVADNGIGMEPDVMAQLFRFKFTNKKDGTGIGLHLSKMILKLHEGSISVQSRLGEGTSFTLCLPLISRISETDSLGQLIA